jgi:3-oxoacyl-[acyl-carrier-protein] synthase-3
MKKVFITKTAVFFPNAPVSNDDMEAYLGMAGGRPSPAKNIVLRRNGIKERYYALDRAGNVTHTNVQLAVSAIRKLFHENFSAHDIELLLAATSTPEQILPSHGVMVHGMLGGKNAEVASLSGSCCTGIQALKRGYLSLLSGEKNNAVCVASERASAWTRAKYFSPEVEKLRELEKSPILAFEKDFLRWMLSDGAGALLLQNEPAPTGISFEICWIDICSYANELKACMYAGGEKNEQGDLVGWTSLPEEEWLSKSVFALKQDTRLLGDNIVRLGGQFLMEVVEKRNLKPEEIDWFLPHLSSMFFKDKILKELSAIGFPIPEEKWFVNLPKVGNVGSASNFVMLEELSRSEKLKKGHKILFMVPESARFSYGYCLLTAC